MSEWARKVGLSYRRAWQLFKEGKIPNAYKLPSGSIVVLEEDDNKRFLADENTVAIYCRVSSHEARDNLERQAERLKEYALAKGYRIVHIVKEVGSGVNDTRPKLIDLLRKKDYRILLVEHNDRLTRFGFNYIRLWLEESQRTVEVVNSAEDEKEELIRDFVAVIYSFAARLYGLRRARRKAEKIVGEIINA